MKEPTSTWIDPLTGKVIGRLYAGSWPEGQGPEAMIRRHHPLDAVERTLTAPELEARARSLLPAVVAAVADLRRRVLEAADVAEGEGELVQVVEVVGAGVVAEVAHQRGQLIDLRAPAAGQPVARAAAALDAAWAALPAAVGQSRRDRGQWTSQLASRGLGLVALELGAAWSALADVAVVLDVDVPPAPFDATTTSWWDRAEEAAAALATVSGMVGRAVAPARRASGDVVSAAAALEAAELECLRLANVCAELAAEVTGRG